MGLAFKHQAASSKQAPGIKHEETGLYDSGQKSRNHEKLSVAINKPLINLLESLLGANKTEICELLEIPTGNTTAAGCKGGSRYVEG